MIHVWELWDYACAVNGAIINTLPFLSLYQSAFGMTHFLCDSWAFAFKFWVRVPLSFVGVHAATLVRVPSACRWRERRLNETDHMCSYWRTHLRQCRARNRRVPKDAYILRQISDHERTISAHRRQRRRLGPWIMKSVNNRFVTANSVFVGLLAGVGESPSCRHAINTGNSVVGEAVVACFLVSFSM